MNLNSHDRHTRTRFGSPVQLSGKRPRPGQSTSVARSGHGARAFLTLRRTPQYSLAVSIPSRRATSPVGRTPASVIPRPCSTHPKRSRRLTAGSGPSFSRERSVRSPIRNHLRRRVASNSRNAFRTTCMAIALTLSDSQCAQSLRIATSGGGACRRRPADSTSAARSPATSSANDSSTPAHAIAGSHRASSDMSRTTTKIPTCGTRFRSAAIRSIAGDPSFSLGPTRIAPLAAITDGSRDKPLTTSRWTARLFVSSPSISCRREPVLPISTISSQEGSGTGLAPPRSLYGKFASIPSRPEKRTARARGAREVAVPN